MRLNPVLPMLALALSSCAARPQQVQPIPALAEQHQCPAFPLPPAELLRPPAKTDFLPPPGQSSGQAMPSPQPSRRSSSTN